ncbi:MAG TPA: CHAD domain-containing protein [Microlunatus sp.]
MSKKKPDHGQSKPAERPTVADVLGPYLIEQCTLLLTIGAELERAFNQERAQNLPAARIHQARVACRKLRSLLGSYGEFFDMAKAGRLSDDTDWFGARLGALRDLDVLGERLTAAMADLDDDLVLHAADRELAEQLRYRRRIALASLRDALHLEGYANLLAQLQDWQQQPAWSPAAQKSATKIKKCVKQAEHRLDRRLRQAAEAIRADGPEADDLIHTARKAAKRHRYAVEAAQPALGSSAERTIASRRRLQDQLGDYQDSRLAAQLLRDLGGIPGRNGFTFGVLMAQEQDHRRRLRKKIATRSAGS